MNLDQECYLLFDGEYERFPFCPFHERNACSPCFNLFTMKIKKSDTLKNFLTFFYELLNNFYIQHGNGDFNWGPKSVDDIDIEIINKYGVYIYKDYFVINTQLSKNKKNLAHFPDCFEISYGTCGAWNTSFHCILVLKNQNFIYKFVSEIDECFYNINLFEKYDNDFDMGDENSISYDINDEDMTVGCLDDENIDIFDLNDENIDIIDLNDENINSIMSQY